MNKQIQLHGIEIYGRTENQEHPELIMIKLKDENEKVLIESSVNVTFDGTAKTYSLCFDKSILLTPGKTYAVVGHRIINSNTFYYHSSMNCKRIITREINGVHFHVNSQNICASIIFSV